MCLKLDRSQFSQATSPQEKLSGLNGLNQTGYENGHVASVNKCLLPWLVENVPPRGQSKKAGKGTDPNNTINLPHSRVGGD